MKTKKDLSKQPQWVQDEFKKLQIKIARLEKEQQNSSQFSITRLENKINKLRNTYSDIIYFQTIAESYGLTMSEVNSEAIKEKIKMIDFFIKQIQEIQKPI